MESLGILNNFKFNIFAASIYFRKPNNKYKNIVHNNSSFSLKLILFIVLLWYQSLLHNCIHYYFRKSISYTNLFYITTHDKSYFSSTTLLQL